MLPITTKDIIEFSPPRYKDDDPARPVYRLAVPDWTGRPRFRRKMTSMGAHYPSDEDVSAAFRAGAEDIITEPDRSTVLELLDLVLAKQKISEEDNKKLITAQHVVAAVHPPLAHLISERNFYSALAPLVATKLLLTGIANGVEYKASSNGASDATITAIPSADMELLGAKAVSLFFLEREQEKNLPSPSM